ncbi:MAG TPA: response regulator, partial [Aggregatilineales bacterium]|nr:response regulator [Aggregatilineales bacterium]
MSDDTSMRQIRVLIVTAIEEQQRLLKIMLDLDTQQRFETHTAARGTEALAYVAVWQPSIVMIDFDLPDMNAIQLTENILRNAPTTGIIHFSKRPVSTVELRQSLIAGARDFLEMPFAVDDLIQMLLRTYDRTASLRYAQGTTLASSTRAIDDTIAEADDFGLSGGAIEDEKIEDLLVLTEPPLEEDDTGATAPYEVQIDEPPLDKADTHATAPYEVQIDEPEPYEPESGDTLPVQSELQDETDKTTGDIDAFPIIREEASDFAAFYRDPEKIDAKPAKEEAASEEADIKEDDTGAGRSLAEEFADEEFESLPDTLDTWQDLTAAPPPPI